MSGALIYVGVHMHRDAISLSKEESVNGISLKAMSLARAVRDKNESYIVTKPLLS